MLQHKPHKTTLACTALKSMATYGKLLLPTSATVWAELFLASVCLSVSVIHVAAVTNMNPGRDQLERRWSTVDQWRRQRGKGGSFPLWVYGKIGRQLIC